MKYGLKLNQGDEHWGGGARHRPEEAINGFRIVRRVTFAGWLRELEVLIPTLMGETRPGKKARAA